MLDFPEAMSEVMNNMKVRRSDWPEGIYIMLKDGFLMIHKEDGDHQLIVSSADMYGENWEVTI